MLGIPSVCVCLSLDLTQGVPPLSPLPHSRSLGKSELRSGVGEGRYIWKKRIWPESPPAGRGSQAPSPRLPLSLKVRAAGAWLGGSRRPEVRGGPAG